MADPVGPDPGLRPRLLQSEATYRLFEESGEGLSVKQIAQKNGLSAPLEVLTSALVDDYLAPQK